jgi:hypothetical protein
MLHTSEGITVPCVRKMTSNELHPKPLPVLPPVTNPFRVKSYEPFPSDHSYCTLTSPFSLPFVYDDFTTPYFPNPPTTSPTPPLSTTTSVTTCYSLLYPLSPGPVLLSICLPPHTASPSVAVPNPTRQEKIRTQDSTLPPRRTFSSRFSHVNAFACLAADSDSDWLRLRQP